MEQPFVTVAVAIICGILASAFFSFIQSRQRGVPASEQGLLNYIRQLEGERVDLKASIRALEEDIKYREKERELLREERQSLNFKVALLELKVEDMKRDLDARVEHSGGISASGNSKIDIGRDAAGNDIVRS